MHLSWEKEGSDANPAVTARNAAGSPQWRDGISGLGMTEIARFVGATLATSALFWILGGIGEASILLPGLPLSALMFVAPAIGALVALGPAATLRQLRAGVAAARRWPGRIGRSLGWAPLMPAVVLVTYPLQAWIGRPLPPFRVDWVVVLVLTMAFTVSAIVEEVGWTSVLTVRLLRQWRPVWVGLAVGTLWTLVHSVPYVQAGNPASWVAWQCLFSIVFRVALVFAFTLTGASLSVVVVLHATYNVAWGLYPSQGSHYDPLFATATIACVAVALAAVHALKPASGAPSRRSRPGHWDPGGPATPRGGLPRRPPPGPGVRASRG